MAEVGRNPTHVGFIPLSVHRELCHLLSPWCSFGRRRVPDSYSKHFERSREFRGQGPLWKDAMSSGLGFRGGFAVVCWSHSFCSVAVVQCFLSSICLFQWDYHNCSLRTLFSTIDMHRINWP